MSTHDDEVRERPVLRVLGYLAFALVLLVALVVIAAQTFSVVVSGESMSPTLKPGDRLSVNSLDRDFARFDVVEAARANGVHIVKRVIGLPGDTIWIVGDGSGDVHLVPAGSQKEFTVESEVWQASVGSATAGCCDSDGTDVGAIGTGDHQVVVPEGHYWVIGDNRDNSDDSRTEGFIPADRMLGTMIWRIRPFNRFGSINDDFRLVPVP